MIITHALPSEKHDENSKRMTVYFCHKYLLYNIFPNYPNLIFQVFYSRDKRTPGKFYVASKGAFTYKNI